jgi:hypothetical protein
MDPQRAVVEELGEALNVPRAGFSYYVGPEASWSFARGAESGGEPAAVCQRTDSRRARDAVEAGVDAFQAARGHVRSAEPNAASLTRK